MSLELKSKHASQFARDCLWIDLGLIQSEANQALHWSSGKNSMLKGVYSFNEPTPNLKKEKNINDYKVACIWI